MRDGEEGIECEDDREVATCVGERGAAQRRTFVANRHGLNNVPRESGLKARVGTVMAAKIDSVEAETGEDEARRGAESRKMSSSTAQWKLTVKTEESKPRVNKPRESSVLT